MSGASSPDRPLRILHVFRYPGGGLFRHVLDVARGQIARGHAVGLLCDSTTGGAAADRALTALAPDLELGVHRVSMPRNPGPADLVGLRAIRRLRREHNPHVIHGHGSKGGLHARLPAFVDPAWPARLYTPHGGSFHYDSGAPKDRLYRLTERLLARRTSLFLMESQYIAKCAERTIGPIRQPVRIVYNGLAEHEFEPVATGRDPFDLLYIGEMRALKGVDVLLAAAAELRRQGRVLRVLLVGAGEDEDALKARAAELGLARDTVFEPPQPIRAAMAKARLMVVPSRNESLPYVVLEAAAAGMPLIATNVGGIPEIFGPDRARLIAPGEASVLASALAAHLAKSPADRHAETARLAAHVRARFSYDGMVEGGLAAYRDALAAEGRNRPSG